MEKFMTALMITANLVALQSLSQAQPAYAQSAQDLEPVESVGLPESENAKLEILGVGGEQEPVGATASVTTEIEEDASIEDKISEEGIYISPDLRMTPSGSGGTGFQIITLCVRF